MRLADRVARLERQIAPAELERVIVVRSEGASDDAIHAFLASKGVLLGQRDQLVILQVLSMDTGLVELMSVSGEEPLTAGRLVPASKEQRDAAVAAALRADA